MYSPNDKGDRGGGGEGGEGGGGDKAGLATNDSLSNLICRHFL